MHPTLPSRAAAPNTAFTISKKVSESSGVVALQTPNDHLQSPQSNTTAQVGFRPVPGARRGYKSANKTATARSLTRARIRTPNQHPPLQHSDNHKWPRSWQNYGQWPVSVDIWNCEWLSTTPPQTPNGPLHRINSLLDSGMIHKCVISNIECIEPVFQERSSVTFPWSTGTCTRMLSY